MSIVWYSACKRCGCACDGVEPGVALARSSGQRGPKRLSTGSEQREAAKRARIEIAKATDLEERSNHWDGANYQTGRNSA